MSRVKFNKSETREKKIVYEFVYAANLAIEETCNRGELHLIVSI